jgi:hypothetical protein
LATTISLIIPSLTYAQSAVPNQSINLNYNGSSYSVKYHSFRGHIVAIWQDNDNQMMINMIVLPFKLSFLQFHDTLTIEIPANMTSKNSDVQFSVCQNYDYDKQIPFKLTSNSPTSRTLVIDFGYPLNTNKVHFETIHIVMHPK